MNSGRTFCHYSSQFQIVIVIINIFPCKEVVKLNQLIFEKPFFHVVCKQNSVQNCFFPFILQTVYMHLKASFKVTDRLVNQKETMGQDEEEQDREDYMFRWSDQSIDTDFRRGSMSSVYSIPNIVRLLVILASCICHFILSLLDLFWMNNTMNFDHLDPLSTIRIPMVSYFTKTNISSA